MSFSFFASSSEITQCTALCSRQGTGDTIEESDDHRVRPQLQPERDMWSPTSDSQRCSIEGQIPEGASALDWDRALAADSWPQLNRFPSEADIPPSYSRATGLDSVCDTTAPSEGKRLRINTPDDRAASQGDITMPSLSHQLTASELLKSR